LGFAAGCSENSAQQAPAQVELDGGLATCPDAAPVADGGCTSMREVSGPQGSVRPRYFVARISYAPPGAKVQGCASVSSIDYRGGSSMGTLLSIEASFVDGYDAIARVPPPGNSTLDTFAYQAEGAGLSVDKPEGVGIEYKGSCKTDGVDHDSDLLELWFNPRVDLTIGSDAIAWTLDLSAPATHMTLSLESLKHPEMLTQAAHAKLDALGVSTQDLADIAAQDPFSAAAPEPPDPSRFVLLKAGLLNPVPFEPSGPDSIGPTITFDVATAPQTTPFERAAVSYTVPATVEGDQDFSARLREVSKDVDHWTWTSASHRETRRSDELVAEIVAGSPGPDYRGPISLGVYYDAIYRSFTFIPFTPHPPQR
jgi:hypothetical protein